MKFSYKFLVELMYVCAIHSISNSSEGRSKIIWHGGQYNIYVLFFYNSFMEATASFGAVDRYFSAKNEQRIWRLSFFLRTISITIMSWLLWIAVSFLLMNIGFMPLGLMQWPMIMITLMSVIAIVSMPVLVKKRAHEFGNDGNMLSMIVLVSLVLNFVISMYNIIMITKRAFLYTPSLLEGIVSYLQIWLSLVSIIIGRWNI